MMDERPHKAAGNQAGQQGKNTPDQPAFDGLIRHGAAGVQCKHPMATRLWAIDIMTTCGQAVRVLGGYQALNAFVESWKSERLKSASEIDSVLDQVDEDGVMDDAVFNPIDKMLTLVGYAETADWSECSISIPVSEIRWVRLFKY